MVGNPVEISAVRILEPVVEEMEAVEDLIRQEIDRADPSLIPLLTDASLIRGKGLRPGLVLLMARATGEYVPDHIILAAAVEMIHNATLVHDDILDEATSRRNRMTLNLKYNNETAVLVGDYIFARAFVLANSLENREAVARLSHMTSVICRGEIAQVLRRYDTDLDEATYMKVIADKTASLYETASELGALLAGADASVVKACAAFGRCLGVAFQIVDDCLDLTGQESVMGKTLATDLDKGKLTLPLIRYLQESTPGIRDEVLEIIASDTPRSEKRTLILDLFQENGALDYAYDRARSETEQAMVLLRGLRPSPARDALEMLASFVVSRRH